MFTMKVFISWSGQGSHAVALALKDWLPRVLQSVEPWVSSEDINKGARWLVELSAELADTSYGIVCLTPESLNAPWVLFEAGALSKGIELGRVSPLLVGLTDADLSGPLATFQTTKPDLEDLTRLVLSINRANVSQLGEQLVTEAVAIWWPALEEQIREATALLGQQAPDRRDMRDMLSEVLELTRSADRREAERTPEVGLRIRTVDVRSDNEAEKVRATHDQLTQLLLGLGLMPSSMMTRGTEVEIYLSRGGLTPQADEEIRSFAFAKGLAIDLFVSGEDVSGAPPDHERTAPG